MNNITIKNKKIGQGEPCFIIAEAGSNHDCKIEQARQLIDIAVSAGADAVKFQSFTADRIAARTRDKIVKIEIAGAKTLHELYKNLELPPDWLGELKDYATGKGIMFLSTPFDEQTADELEKLDLPAFKIASFELVHIPLLRHVARKCKPIILSTGMASLGEIEEAVNAVLEEGNDKIILMHCGIGYPLDVKAVNLAAMDTIRQAFPYPVGYSDHTLGVAIPFAAVSRGANIIEKHFTISRKLKGPDHQFAMEPDELAAMVKGIRDIEKAIGSPRKEVIDSELVHYHRGRRSLFARMNIPKGTIITKDMMAVLRPGIGLMPKYIDIVAGRKAAVDIEAQEPITWEKI